MWVLCCVGTLKIFKVPLCGLCTVWCLETLKTFILPWCVGLWNFSKIPCVWDFVPVLERLSFHTKIPVLGIFLCAEEIVRSYSRQHCNCTCVTGCWQLGVLRGIFTHGLPLDATRTLSRFMPTVYSCNPEGRIFYWFEVKKVSFMWDFKWLYLKKYSSYEKIINMKNVQNHPNFLKK